MKISVALCAYNGSRHLLGQLKSIALQSKLPDELLLYDDGSSDGTTQLLYEFSSTVPFPVSIVENECNLGSAANFEKAISACVGDIIILADQDDVWHTEKLARIEAAFVVSPDLGLVFSDGELIDEQGRMLGKRLWQAVRFSRRERIEIQQGRAFEVLLRRNVVTGATLAFRSCWRSLILPIPEANWVHDYWIVLIISAVSTIGFIEEALIDYRCHTEQQLGVTVRRSISDLWKRAVALRNPSICLTVAEEYSQALTRLLGLDSETRASDVVIQNLESKIMHLRLRGSLPEKRLHRFAVVIGEIFNRRYFRYSSGWSSIVLDIIFKR